MMRFALACDRMGSRNSQCKCYLGAIVIHLYNRCGDLASIPTFLDHHDLCAPV